MSNNVEFHVDFMTRMCEDERGESALITARVRRGGADHTILIASLEVDGIELVPSARLDFTSGVIEADMPAIRIVRPIPGRSYTLSLHIHGTEGCSLLEEAIVLVSI